MKPVVKQIQHLFIALLLVLSSCVDNGSVRSKRASSAVNDSLGGSGASGDGQTATPGDGSLDTVNDILANGRTELRHLVDPFDGTYKTKLTIPKNYSGLLYLSGLNVSSLNDKVIGVRFRFGKDREEVVISKVTIGRAPGIVPQTDIEVIILDLHDQPFNSLRLPYSLFDYNDYDTDLAGEGDGIEFNNGETPVTDPRDGGLYCRGLNLEDDPTFVQKTGDVSCDQAGEKCHYAYADIKDNGLLYSDNGNLIAYNPTEPHVDLGLSETAAESIATSLKHPLPDTNDINNFLDVLKLNLDSNVTINTFGASEMQYGQTIQLTNNSLTPAGTTTLTYRGPFRPVAADEWHIKNAAIYSEISTSNKVKPTGIFQKYLVNNPTCNGYPCADGGYRSFLFPRIYKTELTAGIKYLGSTSPLNVKTSSTLISSGTTDYMDGANGRVTSFDSYSYEDIGSCTVDSSIEVFTKDVNGVETSLTVSRDVKLQLIRPSLTDYQGKEVLYTSLKTCSSSNSCGSGECCFNNRCWSKEIVSQCIEDVPVIGNNEVGQTCGSDFECASFCCSQSTGTCGVHVNNGDNKVFCGKSPGQTCVAKEWCRKENVSKCCIVKSGFDISGAEKCSLRCLSVPTYGDCIDGTCRPPTIPSVPSFDPNSPLCADYSNVKNSEEECLAD